MLDGHADFERMLNKNLPSKSLNPTMTIIENLRSKVSRVCQLGFTLKLCHVVPCKLSI